MSCSRHMHTHACDEQQAHVMYSNHMQCTASSCDIQQAHAHTRCTADSCYVQQAHNLSRSKKMHTSDLQHAAAHVLQQAHARVLQQARAHTG
jgi:prophage DNA circulation protein